MTALIVAVADSAALATGFWLLVRPAIRHRPHHATGPLAGRPTPLA